MMLFENKSLLGVVIATLGGAAVGINQQRPSEKANPEQSAVSERLHSSAR